MEMKQERSSTNEWLKQCWLSTTSRMLHTVHMHWMPLALCISSSLTRSIQYSPSTAHTLYNNMETKKKFNNNKQNVLVWHEFLCDISKCIYSIRHLAQWFCFLLHQSPNAHLLCDGRWLFLFFFSFFLLFKFWNIHVCR